MVRVTPIDKGHNFLRIAVKIVIQNHFRQNRCDRMRQKSWSPSSVSCVAARKIVRRSVMGPVRDITL